MRSLLLLAMLFVCGCSASPEKAIQGTWKAQINEVDNYLTFGPDNQMKLVLMANGQRADLTGEYKLDSSKKPMSLDFKVKGELPNGRPVDLKLETILDVVDGNHLRYYNNGDGKTRPRTFLDENTYVLERTAEPAPVASASTAQETTGWRQVENQVSLQMPGEPVEANEPPWHVFKATGECQVEVRWGMFPKPDEARAQMESLILSARGKQTEAKIAGQDGLVIEDPTTSRAVFSKGSMVYGITVVGTPEQFHKVIDSAKL